MEHSFRRRIIVTYETSSCKQLFSLIFDMNFLELWHMCIFRSNKCSIKMILMCATPFLPRYKIFILILNNTHSLSFLSFFFYSIEIVEEAKTTIYTQPLCKNYTLYEMKCTYFTVSYFVMVFLSCKILQIKSRLNCWSISYRVFHHWFVHLLDSLVPVNTSFFFRDKKNTKQIYSIFLRFQSKVISLIDSDIKSILSILIVYII